MQKKNSNKIHMSISEGYESTSDADTIAYQAIKQKKNNKESDEDDEGYETDAYQDGQDDIDIQSESDVESLISDSQESAKEEQDCFQLHRANILQRYINFNMKTETRLLLNDFNWEDHAFSVIHRYEPKAAKSLTQ